MPTKYTWWPAPHSQQALFTHCMLGFADTCEWVMLLDVDEFIWMDALTVRQLFHHFGPSLTPLSALRHPHVPCDMLYLVPHACTCRVGACHPM